MFKLNQEEINIDNCGREILLLMKRHIKNYRYFCGYSTVDPELFARNVCISKTYFLSVTNLLKLLLVLM